MSEVERFHAKVRHAGNGCWLWTAYLDKDGYGTFLVDGKKLRAHRWAYDFYLGPVPSELVIDHLCRVPNCVNPLHLELVTRRENILRGAWALKNRHLGSQQVVGA